MLSDEAQKQLEQGYKQVIILFQTALQAGAVESRGIQLQTGGNYFSYY